MAPMERRVRLLGWALRRVASIASMTEDDLAALRSRGQTRNFVTGRILGALVLGVEFGDRTIAGPGGDLVVLVYRASDPRPSAPPLVLNFHGGGFVFGDLSMADWLCSSVVAATGAVVVSVDYRLAPAHPFPAAVEDCYSIVEWAAEHAETLGATRPIGVMGESAGGNLAAVTAMLARTVAARPSATRRCCIR